MKQKSQDKKENIIIHTFHSTIYSLEGIYSALKEERSLHLYLGCAIVIIAMAFFLHFRWEDLEIVFFLLALILVVELLNTALENVVDLVTKEKNPLAKKAKDCGSAATFVIVVIGITKGILLFIPYIWRS